MKALAILVLLASVAQAAPDKAEIMQALDNNFEHELAATKVYGPDGAELSVQAVSQLFSGEVKLGKVTIGFSAEKDTLGWFEAPLTIDKESYRLTGIFLLDHAWTFPVMSFARVVADKDLLAAGKKAAEAMPAKALEGDDTVGRVAYWVSHGFTGQGATAGVAAGTAPSELAVGAATKRLVAGWDKLKMVPTSGGVETVGTYLHLVTMRVMMPIKGTKLGVPMVLTAIVDSDGTYWQWASLQFSPVL